MSMGSGILSPSGSRIRSAESACNKITGHGMSGHGALGNNSDLRVFRDLPVTDGTRWRL